MVKQTNTKTITESNRICKHISRIMGNDDKSAAIIFTIQKWMNQSGPEWTVDRLKKLKTFTILMWSQPQLTSSTAKVPKELELEWFEKDARGFPKGNIGSMIREVLLRRDIKSLGKLLTILNVYKGIKLQKPSKKQINKFVSAIEGTDAIKITDLAELLYQYPIKDVAVKLGSNFEEIYRRNFTFTLAGLNTAKKSVASTFLSKEIKSNIHPWVLSFLEDSITEGPWTPMLRQMGVPIPKTTAPSLGVGGVITLIQEGGAKARVVCMPSAGAQVAFYPLHKSLSHVLKNMIEDCTHDQDRGVNWAARQLEFGKVVHAVDLSSATDNFPYLLQSHILQYIGYEHREQLDKFVDMKFGTTKNTGLTNQLLKYTKGQPMGLYGSFNLFAFSHHVLLQSIEKKVGVKNTYRILGDDIVIANDEVHTRYIECLNLLHVPISLDKCLDSDIITEFAGKVITSSGAITTANGTSAQILNPDQFIQYMKVSHSPVSVLNSVPQKYRDFARKMAMLPVQFGGAGWNPSGIPLIDRLTSFSDAKDEVIPQFKTIKERIFKTALFLQKNSPMGVAGLDILTFLNDLLERNELAIDMSLANRGFNIPYLPADVKRALELQLQRSSSEDTNVNVFYGAILEESKTATLRDTRIEWRTKSESITKTITKIFDSLKPEEITSSKAEVLDKSWDEFNSLLDEIDEKSQELNIKPWNDSRKVVVAEELPDKTELTKMKQVKLQFGRIQ